MVALAGVGHVEKLLDEISGKKQRLRVPPIAILDALLQDTGIPVLDPDKAAISVVVSGVTDIEWPA